MENEKWLPVNGYEGLYEVSDLGRVKRLARNFIDASGNKGRVNEMLMRISDINDVSLRKDGKYQNRAVRSLVAEAFLGLPYGTSLTHLDGDISNARLSNLVSTQQYRFMDPDWRDIPGWEGEYQASRFGQIRSVDRYIKVRGGYKFIPGVIRAMDESDDGYYQVALYRGESIVHTNAHIFIAQAWIPNPERKPTVNHKDGNKKNNCIDNLEWATYTEQQEHAKRTGLRSKPYWSLEQNGPVGGDWNEKRSIRVRCIETGEEYESFSDAARSLGTGASDIKQSVDNHNSVKGLHFVKASEPDYNIGVADLASEEWRDVPGYVGRYQFSNKGRLKALARISCAEGRAPRQLSERLINTKYRIELVDDDGCRTGFSLNDLREIVFGKSNQKKIFNLC